MKQQTIASMKRGIEPKDDKPREGSKIREVYDALTAEPCTPVRFETVVTNSYILEQLRDVYGLDVRWHSRGCYWLVGEFDLHGKYIDYMARQL